MKYLLRLQIAIVIIMLLASSSAFSATAVLIPTQVPKGAYVNGGGGDQQFIQSIIIAFACDGASGWTDNSKYIYIALPSSSNITVADCDGDGSYNDEISMALSATSTHRARTTDQFVDGVHDPLLRFSPIFDQRARRKSFQTVRLFNRLPAAADFPQPCPLYVHVHLSAFRSDFFHPSFVSQSRNRA